MALVTLTGQAFQNFEGNTMAVNGVQAGESLTICISSSSGPTAISAVGDDVDGAWAMAEERYQEEGAGFSSIWYLHGASAGNRTVTITGTPGPVNATFAVGRWTGLANAAPEDTADNWTGATPTTSHPTGEVTASGDGLMIGCWGYDGNPFPSTPPSGWTAFSGYDDGMKAFSAYKITTGETVNPTATTSGSVRSNNSVAVFAAAGGGGGFNAAWARGANVILGVRVP